MFGRFCLRYSINSEVAPGQLVSSNSTKFLSWIKFDNALDEHCGHPEGEKEFIEVTDVEIIGVHHTTNRVGERRLHLPASDNTWRPRIPHK